MLHRGAAPEQPAVRRRAGVGHGAQAAAVHPGGAVVSEGPPRVDRAGPLRRPRDPARAGRPTLRRARPRRLRRHELVKLGWVVARSSSGLMCALGSRHRSPAPAWPASLCPRARSSPFSFAFGDFLASGGHPARSALQTCRSRTARRPPPGPCRMHWWWVDSKMLAGDAERRPLPPGADASARRGRRGRAAAGPATTHPGKDFLYNSSP